MTPERFQRLERIFHDARQHEGAQRAALLAAACGDDSGLRRDVESLLEQTGPGVVDLPAAALAAALLPRSSRLPAAVGPYTIEALIGAGGMGDVYRARDTRLGRSVALKMLPDSFTTSADRVARFRREAQLLAALNHPHIAQIHGLEEAGGSPLLVLELVEGETLDKHIARGPFGIDEALGLAAQIASALEAAHDKGIIHRDLKPANIALTADRQVKVLDFGLAKAIDSTHDSDGPREPSDESARALTGVGVVLGTVAYMAPEQAAGRRADKRVDVWAFGCVLFEMLTRTRAFPGEDQQRTLAAVLTRPPDWRALPPNTPAPVRRLLRRCLERDPAKRLKDIGDARLELADALARDGDLADELPRAVSRGPRRAAIVAMAGVFALALAPMVLRGRQGVATSSPALIQRLSLTFPDAAPMNAVIRQFALSADGKSLSYVGANGRLWIRSLDGGDARELPGTDGAWNPFFSPDGEWIGYIEAGAWGGGSVARAGTLKKVALGGGVPVALASAVALGGSWGRDGTIVFCNKSDAGVALFTIRDSGGTPAPLTNPPPGKPQFRVAWPSRLPDDRTVIFSETDGTTFENGRTVALSLLTGKRRVLLEQGYAARYVPSSHLVYALNGSLMAIPFDASRLATSGRPTRMLNAVVADRQVGWLGLTVASTGTLLYDAGLSLNAEEQSVQWIARDGSAVPILTERTQFSFPRLSPDGGRLAVGAGNDIWVLDLRRGTRSRIDASDRGNYPAPAITAWTADGRHLAMNRRNTTDTSIALVDPDDVEHATTLVSRPYFVQVGSWSKAGAFAFFQIPGGSARDVWVIDPESTKPRPFAATRFNERGAVFSPDGRWLAYAADPTGRDEVYVRAYPGPAPPVAVSTAGGTEPAWSRNGHEIFYREGQRMMTVSFAAAPQVTLGRPQLVFDQPFSTSNLGVADYDVAADGRFVMVRPAHQNVRPVQLSAVTNWFEDLRARAGVNATR